MKKSNISNELILRLTLLSVLVVILIAVVTMAVTGVFKGNGADVPAAEYDIEDIYLSDAAETTSAVTATDAAPALTTSATSAVPEVTEGSGETSGTSVSRTIITSRVRKDYDSNSVYVDMENILQLPELPVGCEITALTILLRYCGFDADKSDLAKNYLPKGGHYRTEDGKVYKDSFFDYFIGDPFSRGYGCFSGAIEKAANAYISDHGGGFTVKNISGAHPDELYDYLAEGTPVLCWATDGMIEPEYYETWYDYDTGEQLDWYLNEHCFVLAGFNMSADLVTLNDPMKGIIDYNINKFETRYDQMHRQAIVILPASGEYEPAEREKTTVTVSSETETEDDTDGEAEDDDTENGTEGEAETFSYEDDEDGEEFFPDDDSITEDE